MQPSDDTDTAAAVVQVGGLVAFSTGSGYGLGTNGEKEKAMSRTFLAKGRRVDQLATVRVEPAASELLDGGPCTDGIESAITDVTGLEPAIAKPRGVTPGLIGPVAGQDVTERVRPLVSRGSRRAVSPTRVAVYSGALS